MLKRVIKAFVKTCILLILPIHFILTILYVMPITPVKIELQRVLNLTIGTFFPQNWSLFAPDPISRNESLLVMCIAEDNSVSDIDSLPRDKWQDITAPLWAAIQRNRFTAYGRIERIQGNAIRQYTGAVPQLEDWRKSCSKGLDESCEAYKEKFEKQKEQGEKKLVKIVSSYCHETAPSATQVAVRIRIDKALRWSKRYTDEKEHFDLNVGIFPVHRDVELSGIYK